MLRFEALRAKQGDCLLIHHGTKDKPRLCMIDGGPGGVWNQYLKKRLTQLRGDEETYRPRIGLLMVSHIDDDHINGLIQLTEHLKGQLATADLLIDVDLLWHNSFDDVFGEAGVGLARGDSGNVTESSVEAIATDLQLSDDGALVVASVGQGRVLRDNAQALAWNVNSPFDGPVRAGVAKSRVTTPDGLDVTVLGPGEQRIQEFHEKWDEELKKENDKLKTAAYLDESVYNLASIVVLVEVEGHKILLTGDARGDDIISGARNAGLFDDGPLHVDLLKVPHHGSNRNVDVDFFESFPADHYVFSGDGSHGNPELDTFRMLFEGRTDQSPFTIYLTYNPSEYRAAIKARGQPATPYPVEELRALFDEKKRAGSQFDVVFPAASDPSVSIDLA
jgi:hypothetical protein